MHRSLSAAVISAIATYGAQVCLAADADGYYRTTGAPSCAQFIDGQRSGKSVEALQNLSWIAGYVSAYNASVPATYDILGNAGIDGAALWMSNYCSVHPLEDIARGMETLVREQRPKRDVKRPAR